VGGIIESAAFTNKWKLIASINTPVNLVTNSNSYSVTADISAFENNGNYAIQFEINNKVVIFSGIEIISTITIPPLSLSTLNIPDLSSNDIDLSYVMSGSAISDSQVYPIYGAFSVNNDTLTIRECRIQTPVNIGSVFLNVYSSFEIFKTK
jgi:hypothetical protein